MLCIRKSPVAEKFMDRREWEVPGFPFKFFYLKASQNAEREPFSLSLISGIEKVRIVELGEGGRVKIFSPNCLVSKCRNTS